MATFDLVQPSDHEVNRPETKRKLERFYYEVNTRLGGQSIDVHLEDEDFDVSWRRAVDTYRTHSGRCYYKSYAVIDVLPQVQQYIFDEKVDSVTRLWRARGLFGGNAGGSGAFESFGAATANTLLRGGIGQNGAAFDLVSYDLTLQYQETLDRLFVRELHFVWRNETNSIFLTQVPDQDEVIIADCSVLKSWEELLNDHWAYRWLQEYSMAECKVILGEKYRLFSTLPGAQGGTVMKGEALVSEGWERKQVLEDDLLLYSDSGEIPQPIRG